MQLHGQKDLALKGGEEWTKELLLPMWHFATNGFGESIDTVAEIEENQFFMVTNQYIREYNYVEPKLTAAAKRKKKAVAFETNPGDAPRSAEL
jgi:hypothetical protein